jgi:hypothetical protein
MVDPCFKGSQNVADQAPLNTFCHNLWQIFHMMKTGFAQAGMVIVNFHRRIHLLFTMFALLEGINRWFI